MSRLLCWIGLVCTLAAIAGCGGGYAYQGEVPKTGANTEKIDYKAVPNVSNPDYEHPNAIVIGLPEIRIDKPDGQEEEPHQVSMPPSLKTRQPFALQGVLKADPKIVDETVILVEVVQTKPDGRQVITQSSAKVVDNVNGELRYRINFPLPARSGKHHLRIGAMVGDDDEYMVPIAEGDLYLSK